ncbi:OB-fold-containig protein [Paractinoplanes durhamensis]|uniref:DUF1449 domain-containing protein n=1 Tax=Paractinoplanes durhamensis TaxID=113563 RepID=A0ABQ3Z839_9ACTN|nr:OB-fold-containig protein [Actinoplanes durhamensis]GIE05974.1 hypothetical protein Adu01nite_73240 [Actinoplanes durhamensis]
MSGFIGAALSFPTVLFTPLLIIVIGFWIVVIAGGADPDAEGSGDLLDFAGLGGVPVSVPISLLVVFAWFGSLSGAEFLPGWLALIGALIAAWLLTRIATVLIRRFGPLRTDASRNDFLGRTCVIQTGRVTSTFGQAEVRADDGSSAIVQVRQAGDDDLHAGTVAVLYDYDSEGEFFWVVPADIATGPSRSGKPQNLNPEEDA